MATQQGVIKSFMKSLDTTSLSGESALNAAIKACSNSKYTTIQSVINQMISDCNKAGSADKFLKDYCGIILDNSDTGAVTGSDMGGSTTKTDESIVPESGSLKSFTGSSFTTNGLKFKLSYVYDTDYNYHSYDRTYSSLSSTQKFIWQGLYTWWGKESLNLLANSYGSNFGFTSSSTATVNEIHVGFYNSNDGTLAYVSNWTDSNTGKAVDLDLMVNMYYYDNVDTSDPNGSTSTNGAGYLDRTLAHEFTHAVMAANITDFDDLPKFIKEGMAELTHGIDDERYYDIKYLAGSSSALQNVLNMYSESSYVYAGGYMFLHYLAKQVANGTDTSGGGTSGTFKFTNGDDYYVNTTASTVLSALGGNDTVDNYANKVKIYGGTGNDSIGDGGTKSIIDGGSGNDYVYLYSTASGTKVQGGAGKDTIHSGTKNSSLNGGAGNDYIKIYFNASKTTVYGGAGNDTIRILAEESNSKFYAGSGNDSIVGGGIKNSISGGDGNDYFYFYNNDANLKVIGGAGKDTIYNASSKSSLSGGAGNDYFVNYSDAVNTTINGGTGNDTITNYSSSKNTYVYKKGDGNDVITGFNFGTDRIKITSGSITKKSYSGNDVILKIGTGSIKIKNGKGQKITVVDSNGKTKTYKVGSSSTTASVSKLWFANAESSSGENTFGQTLSNITSSTNASVDLLNTENDPTSTNIATPTGPVVPTKYIIYADKDKI